MTTAALAIPETAAMPIMSMAQAVDRYKLTVQFVSTIMRENIDYGVIPGTGNKPTLLKPGAEKLLTFFGLRPTFEVIERAEDWTGQDHNGEPFFYYWFRCRLLRGGDIIAEGDGSCNSRESKYRYRKAERVCPQCSSATIRKSKQAAGWYCWAKLGGCGATFPAGDKRIEAQEVGRIPNPDVADQVNTIQKMAQKRALVAAALLGVNASEFFTQDLEDLADDWSGPIVDATATVVGPVSEGQETTESESKSSLSPGQQQKAANGNGKGGKLANPAKCPGFAESIKTFLAKLDGAGVAHGYYLDKGGVDLNHVLASAAACGHETITADNLPQVIADLEARIIGKAQAG